ncbi:MAG: hypothetical protein DUD39_05305 [Coriobacteriaceae bacterium]|nr:MAG: hypothetical protein DUD39_05305 [Coriobacteriaceae bacterium]
MHGWIAFTVAYAAMAITVFAPGYFFLRCLALDRGHALCLSPLASSALITLEGILYAALDIYASWISTILLPVCVLTVILYIRMHVFPTLYEHGNSDVSWPMLTFYTAISLIMTIFMFAGNLDGAAAFQPDNDNSTHLSIIKTMSISGNYSILETNSYLPNEITPYLNGSAGYYPAVFHAFAASGMNLCGVTTSLAENTMTAVAISLIYPAGFYILLLSASRSHDRRFLAAGALATPMVQAFPWRFLTWGPLFSNLFSFALIPAAFAAFVLLLDAINAHEPHKARLYCIVFLIGVLAIAAAHPNGIFTLGIFTAIYLVHLIVHKAQFWESATRYTRPILAATTTAVVVLVWGICFKLPALQGVITYHWDPYLAGSTVLAALLNILSLKLTSFSSNTIAALFLFFGFYACARNWKQNGWMLLIFVFTVIQALAAGLLPNTSELRFFLCGFWYNDPNRIAANVGIAAVPLIASGLYQIFRALGVRGATVSRKAYIVEGAIFCLTLAGAFLITHFADNSTMYFLPTTASESTATLTAYKYGSDTPKGYDLQERQFVDKALQLIPQCSLILNIPNDGSCFAYTLQDANVFWRTVTVGKETPEATLLRTQLDHISTDSNVQEAASSIGAQYLLLLDIGADANDLNRILPTYRSWQWKGLNSVNDSTPGFTVILSQDDMRLYHINY